MRRVFPLILCVFWAFSCGKSMGPAALYVSPGGNDEWSGTLADVNDSRSDGPFATLEAARTAVREMIAAEKLPSGGVTVFIRGGMYRLNETFRLGPEDAGTVEAPVAWRGYEGETARFIGGAVIGGFSPVDDATILERLPQSTRGHVLAAHLPSQGVSDFGTLTTRGMGRPITPAALELFSGGFPMTLARWPNDDWVTIADVPTPMPDPMDESRTADSGKGFFAYSGNRPARWRDTGDIWVHGYWTWDWADSYERIKTIDTTRRIVTTHEPHGVYGYKKGQRFYYLNILEELDSPGEWYLDRDAGMLYFRPPGDTTPDEMIVSVLEQPLVALDNTAHVIVQGLALECGRGDGVVLDNCDSCSVRGCIIRNLGNRAVVVNGGTGNSVLGCDMYFTGDGGIVMSGGDRATLTPGGNEAVNNHIHNYSRWVRTYRPAIQLDGVGNRVAHNLIHDAPHTGVLFGGNNHILEYNEVHSICRETGDVGAFYIGRDWTMRGNIIRYNYFHNIEGPYTHGAMAVYLDDAASGTTIYGNVFFKASRAAFIGGGRDNLVENNLFVDCYPSVHVDARGIGWAASRIAKGGGWQMYEKLDAVRFSQPPYSERYPELATLPDDIPELPKGNIIRNNISHGGRWLDLQNGLDSLGIVMIENNIVDEDPGFIDPANGIFELRDDAPAYARGFEPIPFKEIGLITDDIRLSIPRVQ